MLSAIVIEKEMGSKAALTDDHVNGGVIEIKSGRPVRADLAPLRQRPAESTSEKASLHRIIFIVSQYGDKCFWLIMRANLLYSSWGAKSASRWHH